MIDGKTMDITDKMLTLCEMEVQCMFVEGAISWNDILPFDSSISL